MQCYRYDAVMRTYMQCGRTQSVQCAPHLNPCYAMYVRLSSGQTKQCSASLHCRVATAGKLWGPALLLARHCGDKAFVETAAAMAESSTVSGTPLNSVTLLMAGRADAVPHQTIAAGMLLTSVCCPVLTVLLVCNHAGEA